MQLSEAILHQGLVPDVITYSTLISACEQGQKPQHATQMLRKVSCATCSPTTRPPAKASRVKKPQLVLPLVRKLQLRGLRPDVITYSALISACEKGQQPQYAP